MADTEIQIAYENGYHDGYQLALSELNGKKFEKVTRCQDCTIRDKRTKVCQTLQFSTPDTFFCGFGEAKDGDGE